MNLLANIGSFFTTLWNKVLIHKYVSILGLILISLLIVGVFIANALNTNPPNQVKVNSDMLLEVSLSYQFGSKTVVAIKNIQEKPTKTPPPQPIQKKKRLYPAGY